MRRSGFLFGLAAASSAAIAAAAPSGPIRIVVLGDSLALGTGATRADGGFIFRAYRRVLGQRPGSRIDNLAIGGARAADVVRLEVARVAGRGHYDVAIVCVGGNDVVRGTSPAAFAQSYARLLTGLRAAAPGTRIVCCGVPDVSISPLFATERAEVHRASIQLDRAVRVSAARAGAEFVDLFVSLPHGSGAPDAGRLLGEDRFHPSDLGYLYLDEALTPVLLRAAGLTPTVYVRSYKGHAQDIQSGAYPH